MGTKNGKGTVSVECIGNRIRLRWRFQKKRYSLNLFHYTKFNLIAAKKIALQIEQDTTLNEFDFSLKKYAPKTLESTPRDSEVSSEKLSLVNQFECWVKNYRNMDCDRDVDYWSTRNMMLKWKALSTTNILAYFNKEDISPSTYNRRLNLLKTFFSWTTKNKITSENPFEDVLSKKAKRTEKRNRKPFTPEEITRILIAFKENIFSSRYSAFPHSHYYPFLYFLFQTGVRNAEAVGLRVENVDLRKHTITIKEVLARTIQGTNPAVRIRKSTKNGKRRIIPLTQELKTIIEPLLVKKDADDLVFLSHKNLPIDDSKFQKRVFRVVLNKLGIEHRVLYACRHTFTSRCIEAGISPVTTAFLLGNNPETALRNYTHQLSIPTSLPKIVS